MRKNIIIFTCEIFCFVLPLILNAQIRFGPTKDYYVEAINECLKSLSETKKTYGVNSQEYCDALANVESMYYYAEDYEKSIQYALELLSLSKKLQGVDSKDYILTLGSLSESYYGLENYKEAIRYKEQNINLMKKNSLIDETEHACQLYELGEYYEKDGNFNEAVKLYNKALKTLIELKADFQIEAALNTASMNAYLGYLSDARELLGLIVAYYRNMREEYYGSYHCGMAEIAKVYIQIGDTENALKLEEEVFNYLKSKLQTREMKLSYAEALLNFAINDFSMENYYKSILKLEEAITIYENLGETDHSYYIACLDNLSGIYEKIGEIERAFNCKEKSYALYKSKGDSYKLAICLDNYGRLYARCGNYKLAIEKTQEAIQIFETSPYWTYDYIIAKRNLADHYSNCGENNKSLEIIEPLLEQIKNDDHYSKIYASCLKDAASYNYYCGNKQEAINKLKMAIEYFEINPCDNISELLDACAILGIYLYDIDKLQSHNYIEKTLSLFKDNYLVLMGMMSAKEISSFWDNHKESIFSLNYTDIEYDIQLLKKGFLLNALSNVQNNIANSGDSEALALLNEIFKNRDVLLKQIGLPIEARIYDIQTLRAKIDSDERKLAILSKDYKGLREIFNATWKDIKDNLKTDEIAIEFYPTYSPDTKEGRISALLVRNYYDELKYMTKN